MRRQRRAALRPRLPWALQLLLGLLLGVLLVPQGEARLWGDAIEYPGHTLSEPEAKYQRLLAAKPKGPCREPPIVITVSSYKDIYKRTRFPRTRRAVLQLVRSVGLPGSLVMGANFSCTVIRPHPKLGNSNPTIYRSSNNEPVLMLMSTSNVLIHNVHISGGMNTNSPSPCGKELYSAKGPICPAVFIYKSWGVQLANARVNARIDVYQSVYSRLDNLIVTMPKKWAGNDFRSFNTHGLIRHAQSTAGNRMYRSNNVISNNYMRDVWEGITLFRGSVGVTVRNNEISNYLFDGIRCGADTGYVMDCHLNLIAYNFMTNPASYVDGTSDVNHAGIYFCTHWFNPGNVAMCNYIFNSRQCYYLDFASSGIKIDGGVCGYQYTAVKINNGKYNVVRSLITAYTTRFASFVSCVTVSFATCYKELANNWEAIRRRHWNTPQINKLWPYMRSICNPRVPDKFRGIPCNPPWAPSPATTGKCSGLAYGNDVEVWYYRPNPTSWQTFLCSGEPGNYSQLKRLNRQKQYDVTGPQFKRAFLDEKAQDYGVRGWSPIFKMRPSFRSCPKSRTGRKPTPRRSYYNDFNIPRPRWFSYVLNFDFDNILDTSLKARVI